MHGSHNFRRRSAENSANDFTVTFLVYRLSLRTYRGADAWPPWGFGGRRQVSVHRSEITRALSTSEHNKKTRQAFCSPLNTQAPEALRRQAFCSPLNTQAPEALSPCITKTTASKIATVVSGSANYQAMPGRTSRGGAGAPWDWKVAAGLCPRKLNRLHPV